MSSRVYVGNLPMDIRQQNVEDLFFKYGRIQDIELKLPARPPAFAFVAFNDPRDAEDAVLGRDGYNLEGSRLRVELARGASDLLPGRGGYGAPPGRAAPVTGRRAEFRLNVSGLPPSVSWQDLKDHMRKAGEVVYTDVDRRGGGVVEYATRADMERAVRELDDTELRNPFDRGYIRVRVPHDSRCYDSSRDARKRRSRTPSRRRGKKVSSSPSRSRSRRRSRSRSKRRGFRRKVSSSPSESRSPSPVARSKAKLQSKSKSKSKSESNSISRSRSPPKSPSRSHSPLPSPMRSSKVQASSETSSTNSPTQDQD